VNALEERLAEALNANVDHQLGARRPAPPFTPPIREKRRSPWVLPLTAAACVAAIVGGTVAASRLLAHHDQPVSHQPTKVVSSPAPVPTVRVSDARIAVPSRWTLRRLDSAGFGSSWCLLRVGAAARTCTISVRRITDAAAEDFDVDHPGIVGDPPQLLCGAEAAPRKETYGVRTFGGQSADWRRWDAHCARTGHSQRIEQWSDANVPTWVLVGTTIDGGSAMSAVMAYVAQHSQLPAPTRPARAMDRGVLRAVHQTATGVRIELDRTVLVRSEGTMRSVNDDTATYAYDVPRAIWSGAHVKTGQRVQLWTDGRTVRQLEPDLPTSS